jgi:hypothetical protein
LKEAAAILAPLNPEGLPAPEAPSVPLPQAAARDVTGLRTPSLEAMDESALAPIFSRWVMQQQEARTPPADVDEMIKQFVVFAAKEGYPKNLDELKGAMEWIFDPNAKIDEMPPQALLADLFIGFLPGIGEMQAARDTYRDVEQDEVSGWTGLAAIGMLPMVPNLRSAVIAAKNAERAALAAGYTSRLSRVVQPVKAAGEELAKAFDPRLMVPGRGVLRAADDPTQVPAALRDPASAPKAGRAEAPQRLDVEPEATISRAPTSEEGAAAAERLRLAEEHGSRPYIEALRGSTTGGKQATTFEQAEALWRQLDPEQMMSVTMAGSAKRGWYNSAGRMIRAMFGDDTPRFVGLLAATSPQTSVEANLENAMKIWAHWEEMGRPSDPKVIRRLMGEEVPRTPLKDKSRDDINRALRRARDEYGVDLDKLAEGIDLPEGWTVGQKAVRGEADAVKGNIPKGAAMKMFERLDEATQKDLSILDAWFNNTLRALTGSEDEVFEGILSGAKVDSFMRNLLGDEWAATLDTHMARAEGINQQWLGGGGTEKRLAKGDPGASWAYLGYEGRVAQVADMLTQSTGELWTPAQVQESMWTVSKALADHRELMAKSNKGYTFLQALEEMPYENLQNVATFGEQLNQPHILETVGRIDRARGGAGRGALGVPGAEQLAPPRPGQLASEDPMAMVDYAHLVRMAEKMEAHRLASTRPAQGQYLKPALAGLGAAYLGTQAAELRDQPLPPELQEIYAHLNWLR